ncbi:hypothetical protein Tco_1160426 [Tanacetum coccineum]
MLRVFPISLTGAASRWLRNEPTGSIKIWEDLKTKFLNKYAYRGRNCEEKEEINNHSARANETLFQAWETALKNLDKLNNLGREIKKVNEKVYVVQVRCEQCKGPNYTKDCPQKEEGKTLEEAYYTQFGGPFQGGGYRATTPGQTTVPFPSHLDNHYCEEEEGNYGPKFTKAYEASHINNTIPRKEKDPGSFTLPCFINNICFDNALVVLGASASVMPLLTYLNLGLGELAHTKLTVELAHTKLTVELADRTVKYPKGIAENILVRIGKFTFPVDFFGSRVTPVKYNKTKKVKYKWNVAEIPH